VGDVVYQTRRTLQAVGATLDAAGATFAQVVQVTMWVREITPELRAAWDVFEEFFGDEPPARMTATTDFFEPACLVMLEAIAYVE